VTETAQAPTITDVARSAGVSFATAARALGGYGSTSAEARHRVERAARDLGYRKNSLARSMKTGRTQTVGFVGADINNPFFAKALQGATDTARASGFEVLLVNTEEDAEREQAALRVLSERRVDGIIISPVALDHPVGIAELVEQGTAVVCLDRAIRGVPTDTVMIDNVRAAHAGVAHLIARDHLYLPLGRNRAPAPLHHPRASGGGDRGARRRLVREDGRDRAGLDTRSPRALVAEVTRGRLAS
jgi:LacI family transcriptional regulator